MHRVLSGLGVGVLLGLATLASAELEESGPSAARLSSLSEMSLEDLLNVKITSVSKKEEKRSEAAAAVYVLTADEIRRSSASSLPELLRGVPGLQVAQLDGNKWAISARGFNGRFSNKLLVLIDGRSIYSPLFSGVYWELYDLAIEDIARIEVIRGPGGTLWGANAVNGVINITTKAAGETQGGLLSLQGGSRERYLGVLRYGARFSEAAPYRLTLKYTDRASSRFSDGGRAEDSYDTEQVSFRTDWEIDGENRLAVGLGGFDINQGQTYKLISPAPPYQFYWDSSREQQGGHFQLKWDRQISDVSDLSLLCYMSREDRRGQTLDEQRSSYAIDFQHHLALGENNDFLWGVEGRYSETLMTDSYWLDMDEQRSSDFLVSGFLQDELRFANDRLRLTLGVKLEHNEYSGVEIQPSIRLAWVPNETHTFWGALSRAVRTPSLVEQEGRINALRLPAVLAVLYSNEEYESEALLAHEVGWRYAPSSKTAFEVSLYYNDYDRMRSFNLGFPLPKLGFPPYIAIPFYSENTCQAYAYGGEVVLDQMVTQWWTLRACYSYCRIKANTSGLYSLYAEAYEGDSPEHQINLQSHMDLPGKKELDFYLSYVDDLPGLEIAAYWDLDIRFGWRLRPNLELALVAENLLESERQEYAPRFVNTAPTVVERGVYAKLMWEF